MGFNRFAFYNPPEPLPLAVLDRHRAAGIAYGAQHARQPHQWTVVLRQQLRKDVVGKKRHLKIDCRPVLPRSPPRIEGKEMLDCNAFAMCSYAFLMPGHCVDRIPFASGLSGTSYDVHPGIPSARSFAILA